MNLVFDSQQNERTPSKPGREADLSLEVVILLVFGVFMLLFGLLLFWIHMGTLPYSPDSTYGLFLVLVSFQIVTMGKTPFGDLRRSWPVIAIGICMAVIGMLACFVPGLLAEPARILVGVMLFAGGIALLLQLFFSAKKARIWMKVPGILQQLTFACLLVYVMSIPNVTPRSSPGRGPSTRSSWKPCARPTPLSSWSWARKRRSKARGAAPGLRQKIRDSLGSPEREGLLHKSHPGLVRGSVRSMFCLTALGFGQR
ncbi:MAG: DUF308 domain-containing protein, partial [Methanoculleus sp.]|nr:DUF308 domain-containing protein [Methanoculleus sp.]